MDASTHLTQLDAFQKRGYLQSHERWAMLRLFYALKREDAESRSSSLRRGRRRVLHRTSRLFGRSTRTIQGVATGWRKLFRNVAPSNEVMRKYLFTVRKPGNVLPKSKRIPITSEMKNIVREFVRKKRMNRERVTATEVLQFLADNDYISISKLSDRNYEPKSYRSAIRAVQRFLNRSGFRRGSKTGGIRINPVHIAKRNEYLRKLLENRALPPQLRLNEVYSDESYLHHHRRIDHHSLFHPKDKNSVETHPPPIGKRLDFVATIKGEGRESGPGLVPNSMWMFCPQSAAEHPGDYHRVFNSENYVNWFKYQLLANLYEPSLIIIDNAAYHKSLPRDVPKVSKLKKHEVLAELSRLHIPHESNITSVEAKCILRHWQKMNVKIEIEQLANDQGHSVLFTPPCYSDLQPIETVWAIIKGRVALSYTKRISFQQVQKNLETQFEMVGSEEGEEMIERIIDSVDKYIARFLEEIRIQEERDRMESESDLSEERDRTESESDLSDFFFAEKSVQERDYAVEYNGFLGDVETESDSE